MFVEITVVCVCVHVCVCVCVCNGKVSDFTSLNHRVQFNIAEASAGLERSQLHFRFAQKILLWIGNLMIHGMWAGCAIFPHPNPSQHNVFVCFGRTAQRFLRGVGYLWPFCKPTSSCRTRWSAASETNGGWPHPCWSSSQMVFFGSVKTAKTMENCQYAGNPPEMKGMETRWCLSGKGLSAYPKFGVEHELSWHLLRHVAGMMVKLEA